MKEKIKRIMRDGISRAMKRYRTWEERNFIQSSQLIYWVALILVGIEVAGRVGKIIEPGWLGSLVIIILCVLIGSIVKLVATWIITLLLKKGVDELISAFLIIAVIISGVTYFSFRLKAFPVVATGIVIGAIFILFLKSLWSLVIGKRITRFNKSVVVVGIILIGSGIWFLNSQGFEDTYIRTYLNLEVKSKTLTDKERESFKESISGGPYTPLSTSYDIEGSDMVSNTTNLTNYAQNQGALGYVKEKYQGYKLSEVPLRGQVWYPKEINHCPTLFIIHGNHDYREISYLGYDYLGSYLASYGYVMVSIDENACNLLTNENDARAILLLENIALVKKYNALSDTPLYQKIDENRLALAGHSRGGEAVSIAYLFNEEKVNPNNGKIRWNYDFNIRSLIAIAPTVDQYRPTNKSVELEDVNYLIIHGSNDQDLYQFSGMKQYKNIRFTGEGDYIKTALYCAGCNHGQFNSRWGTYDKTGFYRKVLNVKNFVSEEEQERIAQIFIKTFLDCTLKEERTHQKLLEDYRSYSAYLPETLYIQSYQKSDFIPICNFEEDTSLNTGTMEGVSLEVYGGSIWTEGLYPIEAARSNSALYLQWDTKTPELYISVPHLNMTHRNLQLDFMNLQENFKEEEAKILEAEIELEDAFGDKAKVNLSDYATIYPAFLVRLNKLQYLLNEVEYKHQFQTATIPIQAFKLKNNRLDTNQIIFIKIRFTQNPGIVAIDEIGY